MLTKDKFHNVKMSYYDNILYLFCGQLPVFNMLVYQYCCGNFKNGIGKF